MHFIAHLYLPLERCHLFTFSARSNFAMDYPFSPVSIETSDVADWRYNMRREMQEIVPGLYLGPYSAAMKSKKSCLQSHKITHIVCVRHRMEAPFIQPNFPDAFNYLVLDIADSITENIIQYIPQVRDFIDKCLEFGGKVLVHGNAGISRSAALVIAYVMEKSNMTYSNACSYVQQKRFCISPSEQFLHQLREYEHIYRARQSFGTEETRLGETGSVKRKCNFDNEDHVHADLAMIT